MAACFESLLQRILSSEARIASPDVKVSHETIGINPGLVSDTCFTVIEEMDFGSRDKVAPGLHGRAPLIGNTSLGV
jgi:hypothetical protein